MERKSEQPANPPEDTPVHQPIVRTILEDYAVRGDVRVGPVTSYTLRHDPRHLLFSLARYKFCAKMLDGKRDVLDAGCGDGFGIPLLLQSVGRAHGIDIEERYILDNGRRVEFADRCSFETVDLVERAPGGGPYDGALSLDVIEHIPPADEGRYLDHLCGVLTPDAVCFIGTPNATASRHQSRISAEGHINLKTADELLALMRARFHNAFLFSMNDEVVHTGYYPMAHYLMAMGVGPRPSRVD